MTFAGNSAELLLADIDIYDHAGIKHAADVLKHHLTQKDIHPYDIREILVLFHGIDPGYHFA